jgi:4-amino-4-deoxy-L-arabinose transferase-like glycosyltransferase
MLLKGDILARIIHLTYGALTVAAVYAFSRKHFDEPVPLLAAVLFTSIPTAATIATWAYVDLALAFYAFMSFFAVINWLGTPRHSRWVLVAGILSGMAMSVKYTGLTSLVVASVLVLVTAVRARADYRRWLVGLSVLILVAVAFASPWYLKNLAYTGNPIYPYIFGGQGWNQLRNTWLTSIGMRMSPLQLLLLPWDITVLGTQGTEAFDATISPYFLAVLPLALFVRRKHRMLLPLVISSLTIYVLWIAAGAATYSTFVLRTRILLPCFAPLSILAAYVVHSLKELDRKAFSLQRFVLMAIAIGLVINLISQGLAFIGGDPLLFVVGGESREAYLRRHLADGHYDALSQINTSLPSSAKVVFFWEPRSYYCQRQCLPDVVFDRFSQLALTYDSAEEIAMALHREGISHVLVNERWLALRSHEGLFTEGQRELFHRLVEHHLAPVYVDNGLYTLYEVQ